MNTKRIKSIGWLNCVDGSVNLTPCIDGNTFPTLVNVSRDEFNEFKECQKKMKSVAAERLNL